MNYPLRLLLVSVILGHISCSKAESNPQTAPNHYHMRGVIVSGAGTAHPKELFIRHERVKNFVSDTGKVEDMESMTMPFSVPTDENASDLKNGDEVEFDYEISFSPEPFEKSSNFKKLPKGTVKFE